jgi:hypothetical protein
MVRTQNEKWRMAMGINTQIEMETPDVWDNRYDNWVQKMNAAQSADEYTELKRRNEMSIILAYDAR